MAWPWRAALVAALRNRTLWFRREKSKREIEAAFSLEFEQEVAVRLVQDRGKRSRH